MTETQVAACAARVAGTPCAKAGVHQRLETENVHEKHFFRLCDEHQAEWAAGRLTLERLDPSRVTSWTE